MKNLKYIILLLTAIVFTSCEKVIDVDLDTAKPRLVIDAAIKWEKGTTGNEQKIKLTTTTGYFNTTIPTVSGAEVNVTNIDNNQTFNFIENPGTGEYICSTFQPSLKGNYTLTVKLLGETYTASETLNPVPAIDSIEQNNHGGFTGKDIEIKFFYKDDGTTNDFYLFKYKPSFTVIPSYEVSDDKFYQGNEIFGIYSDEDLKSGQDFEIAINSASQRYYNYMSILISIAGSNGGSPFQSPPATLHGNIVNATNLDNYALGYFSLSETSTINYHVQ